MLEAVPVPSSWAVKSYNGRSYYLVEISSQSYSTMTEYMEIEEKFDCCNVTKIERVQNPYQYGKYLLYRQEKHCPSEKLYYMPIQDPSKLEIAMRFNCDYRRLNYSTALFFNSVSQAISYSANSNKIVVIQGLENYSDHDSGRYPKYVVTFESR